MNSPRPKGKHSEDPSREPGGRVAPLSLGGAFAHRLVDQLPLPLRVCDPDGNLVFVNARWRELTGRELEQERGEGWWDGVHPDDRERMVRACRYALRAMQPFEVRYRLLDRQGEYRRLLDRGVPMRDDAGNLSGYVSLAAEPSEEDLPASGSGGSDELRRTREALRRVEEQLRQAQKLEAVGHLAGGVAHDFNNILTAISGYTSLLVAKLPPGDPGRRPVQDIQQAIVRASSLTRQLLAYSRKQVLKPRVLDLNRIIVGLREMLVRLIGEDVELVTLLGEDLWPVLADPAQVEQVLMNLVINGRDAMPRGGTLRVETANVEIGADPPPPESTFLPGPYVRLTVADDGEGMDAATRARIFEPFFTTKTTRMGTGLGLSTVYGIVTESRGQVRVESEPGQGAVFQVFLPRSAEQLSAGEGEHPVLRAPEGSETVLLVEDDGAVRGLVREVLEGHGYTVIAATDGDDALEMAREHRGPVHLLVTDVIMPRMSGSELAGRLRRELPDLRVLFISGYTGEAIVRHGVLESPSSFLAKPFRPEELAHRVREVLDAL